MLDTRLALPTDIPWRRIAVSSDMLATGGCEADRPPRFSSSLAAFRYDPPEEYQPLDDHLISYVKIVSTVAPYAPDLSILDDTLAEHMPPQAIDAVEESLPCYGAILEVWVTPLPEDKDNFPPQQHPYFIDFEPKKRELYEAVTDTGEVLSGSASALSVGKAGMRTETLEQYDLDLGYSFGFNVGVGNVGVGGSGEDRMQVGSVRQNAYQNQSVTTSDNSTERREVQSHTTQLTQMYNLFQAYHLGTNRGVFMIEPRPHVRQVESTFIQGPRALEGIQEVFLVVLRPKAMKDFCLSAILETAHVVFEPKTDFPKSNTLWKVELNAEFDKDNEAGIEPVDDNFGVPDGWIIDKTCGEGGYSCKVTTKNNIVAGPTFKVSDNEINVSATLKGGGRFCADITVHMRRTEAKVVGEAKQLFLAARRVCSCPHVETFMVPDWIPFEIDLGGQGFQFYTGAMTRSAFFESRKFASVIKAEMVRSLGSRRRRPHGAVGYLESDAFLVRLVGALRAAKINLEISISDLNLDETTRVQLRQDLGASTLADVLKIESAVLARGIGVAIDGARKLKQDLLRSALQPKTPGVKGG